MHDSACRWRIVKTAKVFEVILFLNSSGREKLQSFDWSMQISFHELLNHICHLREPGQVNASFFFLLSRLFMNKKLSLAYQVLLF